MNATQLELLHDAYSREYAKRSLLGFCDRMAPVDGDAFVAYRHTKKIIEYLEALERGEISKLIVTMPTQHGKSYTTSERFPAWFLGRNPSKSMVIAAYGQSIADRQSRRVRNLVQSDLWPFDVTAATDSAAVAQWALSSGAIVKAAGVDAALGGFGAHLLIFDDPHKNSAEADSQTLSDSTWTFFTDVFMRRQRRGAKFLIPTTRWNDYDVVGRLLNTPAGKEWTVLNLPGIADPLPDEPDPIGRAKGDVLWPEGPPLPSVAMGEISSRRFDAIIQGRPTKNDGTTFKRPWFANRFTTPPIFEETCVSVDGAWKEGVGNSRSALASWGKADNRYYVVDAWADQLEYVDLRRKAIDFFTASGASIMVVEDAASGMALISELRRDTSIPIIGVPAKGTKEARAESVTPQFESMRVFIRDGQPWTHEWVEEHIRFPAKPNDFVDTTSIALTRLATDTYYAYAAAV